MSVNSGAPDYNPVLSEIRDLLIRLVVAGEKTAENTARIADAIEARLRALRDW